MHSRYLESKHKTSIIEIATTLYDLNRYELTQEMIGHVTQTIKEEVSGLLVSYLLVLFISIIL